MIDRKVVVPEGMLKACETMEHGWHPSNRPTLTVTLEAALRWLSENPIVPTKEQWDGLDRAMGDVGNHAFVFLLAEWQRRMFLAPEPEDEIVSYLKAKNPENKTTWQAGYNAAIADIEAYQRGKASR